VSDADYQRWVKTFEHVMATPEFARLRTEAGFYPFSLTGQAINEYVHKAVDDYGKRASQLGLMR
jgi:putative tricarboxylic transport membrane protein